MVWISNVMRDPGMFTVAMWTGAVGMAFLAFPFITRPGPRALIFRANGRIDDENGSPFEAHNKCPVARHAQIGNIGIWRAGIEYLVVIYSHEGEAFTAARGLDLWQAHKVSVQLNNAWQEMDGLGYSVATRDRARARQPIK
jgi:hypothetical protein